MTETDTSREPLEQLLESIRQHIADLESERDRYSYIAATIRVNAMKRGATDEQIEAFLIGDQSFIGWMIDEIEAQRDTAWNDAIEAAAKIALDHMEAKAKATYQSEDGRLQNAARCYSAGEIAEQIHTLRKGEPT